MAFSPRTTAEVNRLWPRSRVQSGMVFQARRTDKATQLARSKPNTMQKAIKHGKNGNQSVKGGRI